MHLILQDRISFTGTLTLQPPLQLQCVVGRDMRTLGPRDTIPMPLTFPAEARAGWCCWFAYLIAHGKTRGTTKIAQARVMHSAKRKTNNRPQTKKHTQKPNKNPHDKSKATPEWSGCSNSITVQELFLCMHKKVTKPNLRSGPYLGLYLSTAWKASSNNRPRRRIGFPARRCAWAAPAPAAPPPACQPCGTLHKEDFTLRLHQLAEINVLKLRAVYSANTKYAIQGSIKRIIHWYFSPWKQQH